MQPENQIQSRLSVGVSPCSPEPDAHLLRLALAHWVQRQINNLLAHWRLLLMTHGRGQRWRISYRRLLQGAAALLLAGGMLLSWRPPCLPMRAQSLPSRPAPAIP